MKSVRFDRWIALLALAILLTPGFASAQEADTLGITGTFGMSGMYLGIGDVLGDDLAGVYANGHAHTWTLTLHGLSYSYHHFYDEWSDEFSEGHFDQYITRVHATAFDFQFFGPDADVLNAAVSQQLVSGGLTDGAGFEVWNGDYYDSASFPDDGGRYSSFDIKLRPRDAATGVSFVVQGYPGVLFSTDELGYPLVEPQRVWAWYSGIVDLRPGNAGELESGPDVVDIGSSESPPTLSIADGSVLEGGKGASRLNLTVTLSQSSDAVVTVYYATSNGTALATSDYTATSGTLTFQPGETSRTISVSIKGDRQREANETFTVWLSDATGAYIADRVATVTILNDD